MTASSRSAGALEVSTITAVATVVSTLAVSPADAQTMLDPITVVASKVEETVTQALAGVSAVRALQAGDVAAVRRTGPQRDAVAID